MYLTLCHEMYFILFMQREEAKVKRIKLLEEKERQRQEERLRKRLI